MKTKKITALLLGAALAFGLSACGEKTPAEPPDLSGEWTQIDKTAADTHHEAVITDDTITVYWVMDGGDTKSLYWAGSYTAPAEACDTYDWTSTNDTEQTSGALLASGDETKDFHFDGNEITYEASAMGSTTTVHLERK